MKKLNIGVFVFALFAAVMLTLTACTASPEPVETETPQSSSQSPSSQESTPASSVLLPGCGTPEGWNDGGEQGRKDKTIMLNDCMSDLFASTVEAAYENPADDASTVRSTFDFEFAGWNEFNIAPSKSLPLATAYGSGMNEPELCQVYVGDRLVPVAQSSSGEHMIVGIDYHVGAGAVAPCEDGSELLIQTSDLESLEGEFEQMVEDAKRSQTESRYFAVEQVTEAESLTGARVCDIQPANKLELIASYEYDTTESSSEIRLARNGASLTDPEGSCQDGAVVLIDADSYYEFAPH